MKPLVPFLLMITFGLMGCDIFIQEFEAPFCEGGKLHEDRGLCWQDPEEHKSHDFESATAYCEGLTLADRDDWRLPGLEDFTAILGECSAVTQGGEFGCNPCEESLICYGMFGADESIYWSDNEQEMGASVFDFSNGWSNAAEQTELFRVRCVRDE